MKKTILFLFLASLMTLSFSQESKNIELSKKLIGLLQQKSFDKVMLMFDEPMKKALPQDKLTEFWVNLEKQCGEYVKYSDITTEKIQGYNVVYVLCHFKNVNLKMKTAFNPQNQVSGLFFLPVN
jgi:hypothetical protein